MYITLNCVQKLVGHCQVKSSSDVEVEEWLWLSSHKVLTSSSLTIKQHPKCIIIMSLEDKQTFYLPVMAV